MVKAKAALGIDAPILGLTNSRKQALTNPKLPIETQSETIRLTKLLLEKLILILILYHYY